jgi:hypothetical protein
VNQKITTQISIDLSHQRVYYQNSQLENIQSLPAIENIARYEDALDYCRSMARRRRIRMPCSLSFDDIEVLKSWITTKSSPVLIAEAHGLKTSCRDFAVELLDLTRKSQIPAIWALPGTLDEDQIGSIENIITSLVLQTASLNPAALSRELNPISVRSFRTARSVDQWLRLFQSALQGLKFCLVVLDMDLIKLALEDKTSLDSAEFLERLIDIAEKHDGVLKVVALTWRSDSPISTSSREAIGAELVTTDPGFRKVRLMRNAKYRMMYNIRRPGLQSALGDSLSAELWSIDDP